MIQHFQWKEQPFGWNFHFYYKQVRYRGTYQKDGKIIWKQPDTIADQSFLETSVHDLMLYHVYEDHQQ
ncbi:DUF5342 family protein [Alkalicoccus luteus]|uniref:YheE family protein n=1 Tax=Alkalicoccus luteus TaxID=1237094 RepID=A0A969TTT2_9BACI|nr:DUF5342 family protein [Alkalicoccus luteus]NJP36610.1 YheE family protein [Alkalicoccus luteus]